MKLGCLTPHAKEREKGDDHYPLLLSQPVSQDILCGKMGVRKRNRVRFRILYPLRIAKTIENAPARMKVGERTLDERNKFFLSEAFTAGGPGFLD